MKTRGRKPRVISFALVFGTWNTRKGDKIVAVLQSPFCDILMGAFNRAAQLSTAIFRFHLR
jgi:hypothetical protein